MNGLNGIYEISLRSPCAGSNVSRRVYTDCEMQHLKITKNFKTSNKNLRHEAEYRTHGPITT